MANLLSSTDISCATGAMGDLFDTLSSGANRFIVVHKESIKTIVGAESNAVWGYGNEQPNVEYSYTPVNATFPATLKSPIALGNGGFLRGVDVRNKDTEVIIKVRSDAMNYIENGQTEKITFNNRTYNIIAGPRHKPFLTYDYYYYELREIV